MAIIKQGILGKFSGKFGNLIGYSYRGAQVIRSMPKKSTKPPTLAQLGQRMRFGMMVHFLAPLKILTGKGYGNSNGKRSQFAQCMAYNTKHALKGAFPDFEIDYSGIVLTTGHLGCVAQGEVFSNHEGIINFSWAEGVRSGIDGGMDNAVLVVYNPVKDRHKFLRATSDRASQCAILNVPMDFSGDTVHCWLVFISPNGKKFSTSSYLGTVIVA